jgi:signal transduction histidine kinase
MRNRQRIFLEIFRARNPLGSDGFQLLRDAVSDGGGASVLREFLVALNRELATALDGPSGSDGGWAASVCLALAGANSDLTVATLRALVRDTTLQFQDPLVAVVFEAAADAPGLLSLLADLIETEKQLVQFRARAVEALVTKSPGELDAGVGGLEAQPVLRFLNSVLDEIERGSVSGLEESCARWADGFAALIPPALGGEEPQVLEWAGEALGRLASAPTARDTMRLILRILRVNTPLPVWHPAAGTAAAGQESAGSVGALIVDKAIQVVLGAAGARWWTEAHGTVPRPASPSIELWPFNERVLEAALVDSGQPPRVRAMAAGLLRVLDHASPSLRLSPRAGLYAELVLAPHRREPLGRATAAERLPRLYSEERLDLLVEALSDDCESIRRSASEACHQVALEQPAWFQPRHYTKLLPFLSADDPGTRVCTMRTFQALAGFRSRRVAAVVDNISARLSEEGEGHDEEERARRDLEIALGITMDRLVDDVEQLQQEVHALEARRRELLQYIESQAVRVGEEIHHEVLNTLTGYLATALDEEDYRDAKGRLDNLVAELRRIMNNLYPRDLETEGFLQTIRNRLRDTKVHIDRRAPGYVVDLSCSPGLDDATIAQRLGESSHLILLYRIVLEAIINARKHSGGTSIVVSVQAPSPGTLEIVVEDNGSGNGGPFGENTGMALMRRRAEEIGAQIEYRATAGGGTAVVVRLAQHDIPYPEGGPNEVSAARLAP